MMKSTNHRHGYLRYQSRFPRIGRWLKRHRLLRTCRHQKPPSYEEKLNQAIEDGWKDALKILREEKMIP